MPFHCLSLVIAFPRFCFRVHTCASALPAPPPLLPFPTGSRIPLMCFDDDDTRPRGKRATRRQLLQHSRHRHCIGFCFHAAAYRLVRDLCEAFGYAYRHARGHAQAGAKDVAEPSESGYESLGR